MATRDVNLMQAYAQGDGLRHDDVNGLIEEAKRVRQLFPISHAPHASKPASRNRVLMWGYASEEDVPPYSIFGLVDAQGEGNPPRLTIAKMGRAATNGNLLGMFTNGETQIPQGATGHCWAINDWEPWTIKGEIAAGMPCGPKNTGDSWELDENSFGLLSLGEGDKTGHSLVIRVPDPANLLVYVHDGVSAGFRSKLGTGLGVVCYRSPDNRLYTIDQPWRSVQLYNTCSAIPARTYVAASLCVGIGLVVHSCGSIIGSSSSSSSPPPPPSSSSPPPPPSSSSSPPPPPSSSSSPPPPPSSSSSPPPPSSSPPPPPSEGSFDCTGGINFDMLEVSTSPDFILGIKDGCLVKVPVGPCTPGSTSG